MEKDEPPFYAFPHAPAVASYGFPSALSPSGLVAFNAPCSVVYEYALPGGMHMWTLIYAAPAGPGRSIVLTTSANDIPSAKPSDLLATFFKKPTSLLPMIIRLSLQRMPVWKAHMMSNKLFDMDNVFLHQQDMLLQRRGRGTWAADYYMPVQCDSLVIATRRWIDSKAGGGPTYAPGADPLLPLTKAQLQDRWTQHTRHCVPCQTQLAALERRVAAAKVAAGALFAALCALLGTYGLPRLVQGAGAASAAAAAVGVGVLVALRVAQGAARMIEQFKYVGFDHADNH